MCYSNYYFVPFNDQSTIIHNTMQAHFVGTFSFLPTSVGSSIAMSHRFFIKPVLFLQYVFILNGEWRSSYNISLVWFLLLVTNNEQDHSGIQEFRFTSFNTKLFCSAASRWQIQKEPPMMILDVWMLITLVFFLRTFENFTYGHDPCSFLHAISYKWNEKGWLKNIHLSPVQYQLKKELLHISFQYS